MRRVSGAAAALRLARLAAATLLLAACAQPAPPPGGPPDPDPPRLVGVTPDSGAVGDAVGDEAAALVLLAGGATLAVPLAGLVDLEKECAKLRGELAQLEKQLGALEGRLANPGFVERAPSHVVDAERQKAVEWSARRDQLREKVGALCGA